MTSGAQMPPLVPDNLEVIDSYAFEGCRALDGVTIGDSVTTIGSGAFCGCRALKTAELGEGVTTIGDKAFYECSQLASISIPESVNAIGAIFMAGCDYLLPELLSVAIAAPISKIDWSESSGKPKCSITLTNDNANVDCIELSTYNEEGEIEVDAVSMIQTDNTMSLVCNSATSISSYSLAVYYKKYKFSTFIDAIPKK